MAADGGKHARAGEAQGERALAVHRVPGVDRHVDERRLELAEVGLHEAGYLRHLDDDANAGTGDGVQHVGDRFELRADVEHLRLEGLPPGEGEQLAGQLGGTVDGVGDGVQVAGATLLGQVRTAQEVDGGADDGQQVVEVVRHASR